MTLDAPAADLPLIQQLAGDLRAAQLTVDKVEELLGDGAYAALNREQPTPALVHTETDFSALSALIRLFLLAVPVAADRIQEALPNVGIEGIIALGLVSREGDYCRSLVDLRPYSFQDSDGEANLWVASDFSAEQAIGSLRKDHVLGIGQASLTLAQFASRAPVPSALDLGTGCGIQTFHLLRHADHVVATDISERALAFTRFNLLLNAAELRLDPVNLGDRVQLRQGSMLEPVSTETFDLVVSNPPFVITPRHQGESAQEQYTYRDGGREGDSFLRDLIHDLPGVLNPGGSAQFLGNWEAHQRPWNERIEKWFAPELDAWIVQRDFSSPELYAETWLQDASQSRDPSDYRRRYADYLADFQARGVEGVGFGMAWLRRPSAENSASPEPPLRRFEEIEHPIQQPIGTTWSEAIDRWDWLKSHTLSEAKFDVASDVTEERHQFPGAEHPSVILLRQGGGLRRTTVLTTELAGFVSACDGTLTAGQITSALESLLGVEFDLEDQIARLTFEGFLLPSVLEGN